MNKPGESESEQTQAAGCTVRVLCNVNEQSFNVVYNQIQEVVGLLRGEHHVI